MLGALNCDIEYTKSLADVALEYNRDAFHEV